MKRVLILVFILFNIFVLSAQSADKPYERIYFSLDKDVYTAGERIWYSVFCFEIIEDRMAFSNISSTAYIEIHSTDGMVMTSKVSLDNGLGAGYLDISPNMPTGNYVVSIYTKYNLNEVDFKPFSKVLTIYNTLLSEKTDNTIVATNDLDFLDILKEIDVKSSHINIDMPSGLFSKNDMIPITISNISNDFAVFNISVYNNDILFSTKNNNIVDFLTGVKEEKTVFKDEPTIVDYGGEVIEGMIVNYSEVAEYVKGKNVVLSSPGNSSNIYFSRIDSTGAFTFHTGNIYGEVDVVLEIQSTTPIPVHYYIELKDPFKNFKPDHIPYLYLYPDISDALSQKGVNMQIMKRFGYKWIDDYLPFKTNDFLSLPDKKYKLDEYTRFQQMEDIFIEFIPEVRVRGANNEIDVRVQVSDFFNQSYYSKGSSSLILIDAVPLFNQSKLLEYDPLLVEEMNIYTGTWVINNTKHEGILSLSTYKKNAPALKFDPSVKIFNFKGVSLPSIHTGENIIDDESFPDLRETIYWHPLFKLESEDTISLKVKAPIYSGNFKIVIEGVTEEGSPIYITTNFEVQ